MGVRKLKDSMASLGHRMSEKLEEGDFKEAVSLSCFKDSMADRSVVTFMALKEKHPSPHPDSYILPAPDINGPLLSVQRMWPGLSGHFQMVLLGVQIFQTIPLERYDKLVQA